MKKFLLRFQVTGKFYFPLGLLTIEECWPATPSDADLMLPQNEGRERTISLCSHRENANDKPSPHWQTYRWHVCFSVTSELP